MHRSDNLFFTNQLAPQELRARTRVRSSDATDSRGHYFRDTTAIVHSSAFRRMKHKTQVFFAPKNDHVCTRIEHVMHVATIASTICRALDLDPDLAWAIGLGHDLGHTPFGHLGETILATTRGSEGFRHEMYSLRVVDKLANHGRGLNLTYAVRDGIVNHNGERFEQALVPDHEYKDPASITRRDRVPSTWEGVIVRMSDKIAYLGRDLEDAMRLGLVSADQMPASGRDVLGTKNAEIIDALVGDLIGTSLKTGAVGFSDRIYEAFLAMKDFNYRNIYASPQLANYHQYFERILMTLYDYLGELATRLGTDFARYAQEGNTLAARFGEYRRKLAPLYETERATPTDVVFDYVAGMTDDFAIQCMREITVPQEFSAQFERVLLESRGD